MKISKYKKKETVKTIQHDLDKGDLEHHELCMEERRQESSIESLQGKRGGGRRREEGGRRVGALLCASVTSSFTRD
jgi:hypothetical protein